MTVIDELVLAGGLHATIYAAPTPSDPSRARLVIKSGSAQKVSRFFKGETSDSDAMRFADDYASALDSGRFIA
jgi:hypothetical protein